ncbi:MAG: PCP reductase family protein [Synechococcus sp.]|nr:PCP reductase family protein [Synechococcus sp.]
MQWSEEAEQLLREVPFFVRPAVRRRIETLAAEAGLAQVDRGFYTQARARFGGKAAGDDVKE